jgi:hypothetical protein
MILHVRVIPRASRNAVIKENENFKVYLTAPAQDGLANRQLADLLSDYLKIKKYRIEIIKGHKSRDKLIKINA